MAGVKNSVTMQGQSRKKEPGLMKLIYIGPTLPKAALKTNRIFAGTEADVKKEIAPILAKFPLVEKMLVSIETLAAKKAMVQTTGNIFNKYYADLVAVVAAESREEV